MGHNGCMQIAKSIQRRGLPAGVIPMFVVIAFTEFTDAMILVF